MSGFVSDLQGCPVIDEDDALAVPSPPGGSLRCRGRIPRDYQQQPLGFMSCAPAYGMPVIPRSEWDERIRDLERSQSRIPDICDAMGLKRKNQRSTNYCWIFAPVYALEIMRVVQGQDYVELSPASCGSKITNFRNVGGWGTAGLKYLVDYGAVPSRLWPDTAIERQFDTPAADNERRRFQVDEWDDLPTTFDAVADRVLNGFPAPIGLNWWGHEVTATALVKLDGTGRYGMLIDNSWGSEWGQNGRAVLTEAKATPDDAVSPRSVTAS